MFKLVFRQIHLDFHTSEKIPGIGSEFNADEFVDTLKRAHVNSVTVFSRCHHGMIYHDTRFAAKHPFLTCNLLAEQIEACHKAGIRAPIYITVGLDEYMAREHPEWIEVDEHGRLCGAGPLDAGWHKMDFACEPYMDYVIAQTEEVLDMFGDEVDGFFFDIIGAGGVHSKWCMAEYARLGMDPTDPAAENALREILVDRYRERMSAAVRAKNKNCTIFHNSGHISPDFRRTIDTYSHLELESLPSGGWGYAHFPVTMRYARGMGLDCMAMTGKFSKTWGHFNSYKPLASLEYECFNALALGAKCSVGDQLHPRGKLDPATYDLIGAVYKSVEEKEPWCDDVEPRVEIGVYNTEAIGRADDRVDSGVLGAYRMLLESRHQFDLVDDENDWSKYRVIILPDKIVMDEARAAKVRGYLNGGGSILCSYESGLDPDLTDFVLEDIPARLVGQLPYSPDFLNPLGDLADGIADAVYAMYERGLKVEAAPGAEVLASIWEPYFNRTYEHFCSHFHTPPEKEGPDPGVLQMGNLIYFAHPIFGSFGRHGVVFYKQVALNALRRLLPDPLVIADAPGTMHVTWNRQPAQSRSVVHLMHYMPEKRTQAAEYVEDVIPLFNVPIRLRTTKPSRVYLAPGGEELRATVADGYVSVTVPEIRGHTMLVLDD